MGRLRHPAAAAAGAAAALVVAVAGLAVAVPGEAAAPVAAEPPASLVDVPGLGVTAAVPPVWLGAPAGPREALSGGWQRRYEHGMLFWSPGSGVQALRDGALLAGYRSLGGTASALGWPTSDEAPLPTGGGARAARFQHGLLVSSPGAPARLVPAAALGAYDARLGPSGPLGLPVQDVARVAGGAWQRFAGGAVAWSAATGVRVVVGPIGAAYLAGGGPGGPLGLPTGDAAAVPGGLRQDFQRGALVWTAATGKVGPPAAPRPPRPAAPVLHLTAPTAVTRSSYMTLFATASDVSRSRALGCADGRAGVAGLRVLAYGGQELPGIRRPGLPAEWTGPHLSYAQVAASARAYVAGLAECRPGRMVATVVVGTNNYQWAQPDTGAAGGAKWARLVDDVAAWAERRFAGIVVAGGNDIEPSWGPPGQARAWADGYAAATRRPMIAFASADGCPPAGSRGTACNNGWTVADVFHVSTGAGRAFYAVPQIYRTDGSMASQWARISAWGVAAGRGPVRFAGVMSQQAACATANDCPDIDNSPAQAWQQLRDALDASAATRVGDALPGATDVAWMR